MDFLETIGVDDIKVGRQTVPREQNFDVNRKALSFTHLLQVSKKSL